MHFAFCLFQNNTNPKVDLGVSNIFHKFQVNIWLGHIQKICLIYFKRDRSYIFMATAMELKMIFIFFLKNDRLITIIKW